MTEEIKKRRIATANPHINLGILASLSIPIPDLEDQDRIVAFLDSIADEQLAARQVLESAVAVRGSLLSDLLRGDHEIPDSYDVLLDASA